MPATRSIERARDAVREAARVLVLTGAGVSAESGVPTFRSRCTRCDARFEHYDPVDTTTADSLPRCARCGALLRPDVVWFGEPLDERALGEATEAAAHADVCLVVGTSGVVHPAAGLASVTREAGGRVIEVNPDITPISAVAEITVRGRAAEVVPEIIG